MSSNEQHPTRKLDPILESIVEVKGTPYKFFLGEEDVEIQDAGEDETEADSVVLHPKNKEEASRLSMAFRLAAHRMTLLVDRLPASDE